MVTRLTEEDWSYFEDDVMLGEDWASSRAFWRAVLAYAAADNADAVDYKLNDDDECLAVRIGDNRYSMDPPPREFRRQLLHAIRRLAAGGRVRRALLQLRGLASRSAYRGKIVLATDNGDVAWEAYELQSGMSLQRIRNVA